MTSEAPYFPVGTMADVVRLVESADSRKSGVAENIDVGTARLARTLRDSKRRIIGLYPANRHALPYTLASELARALAAHTTGIVVILDPERHGPGARKTQDAPFHATIVCPGVVALAPLTSSAPGAKNEGIAQLLSFVEEEKNQVETILIDLSGCTLPGELLGVQRKLEGIMIVGAAGKVTESELLRAKATVPELLDLGVALAEK